MYPSEKRFTFISLLLFLPTFPSSLTIAMRSASARSWDLPVFGAYHGGQPLFGGRHVPFYAAQLLLWTRLINSSRMLQEGSDRCPELKQDHRAGTFPETG